MAKFITGFDPLQWVLDALPNKLWKYFLVVMTSCFKCASFWITLSITGDVFISAGVSYIASIISNVERTIQTLWIKKLNKNNG